MPVNRATPLRQFGAWSRCSGIVDRTAKDSIRALERCWVTAASPFSI
jgi:hypothetical protein